MGEAEQTCVAPGGQLSLLCHKNFRVCPEESEVSICATVTAFNSTGSWSFATISACPAAGETARTRCTAGGVDFGH